MLALLDTPQDLEECAGEIGGRVGQLLTPLTRRKLRDPSLPWAIDNGAFAGFETKAFMALLDRHAERRADCLFVTAPDIVGSARRTLEVFERWRPRLAGWKIALVCQDGQEDLPLPWDEIDAVFIGGSTKWKCAPAAEHIVRAALMLDKHVHIGRINTAGRWKHFEGMGAHTADGTGLARYSHMREAIAGRYDQKELSWT